MTQFTLALLLDFVTGGGVSFPECSPSEGISFDDFSFVGFARDWSQVSVELGQQEYEMLVTLLAEASSCSSSLSTTTLRLGIR
jgi:hypothetical protein